MPGVLSREQGAGYATQAGTLAGQPINPNLQSLLEGNLMNRPASPYQQSLQDALVNPSQFGGLSQSEQNLVDQAYSGRQAQFNALGIGQSPLAQSAIAAAGAPTLAALRQQRVSNLFQGQSQFDTQQGQFMNNLLQAIQQGAAVRGQTIDEFLNLAKLGQPQLGQQANATGDRPGMLKPLDLSQSGNAGLAAMAG